MAYRFLIVDDTSFMRKMAADSLRKFGYEVAGEASNGKEAVRLYEELRPDVVLMDLTMPEMSGSEAIKAILGLNPEAVVLICSGSNQKEAVLEAMEAGAKGYLLKPFSESRLQEIIRKYAEPFLEPQGEPAEKVSESAGEAVEAASETAPEAAMEAVATVEPVAAAEAGAAKPAASKRTSLDRKRESGKLKHFTSSIMCQWQEERDGETVDYYAVATESENKLLIERRDGKEDKQTLPLTLEGFRELADWLESHLGVRS